MAQSRMSKSVYTTISTILLKQISQAQPIPGLRQLRRGRRLSLQAAMFGVDACAAQVDHFAAQRFVRREIKLALAVIADVRRGVRAVCNRYVPTISPVARCSTIR